RWGCGEVGKGPPPKPQEIVPGPPYFSAPVVRLNACSLCFTTPLSTVVATTYRTLPEGSMTGVPVIPISGESSSLLGLGTVLMFVPRKFRFQIGDVVLPSALNA